MTTETDLLFNYVLIQRVKQEQVVARQIKMLNEQINK